MMNPQLHAKEQSILTLDTAPAEAEMEMLVQSGFTQDEIISLLWLRQWYQNGGSDRTEIIRRLEFLKLLVLNGKLEV